MAEALSEIILAMNMKMVIKTYTQTPILLEEFKFSIRSA
jgi:hypothetical protein